MLRRPGREPRTGARAQGAGCARRRRRRRGRAAAGRAGYRVVVGATGGTLDGFTISGGNADDNLGNGGGIYNSAASPTLSNLTLSGNMASDYGGGMYTASSSTTLSNVTFTGNRAALGGAFANRSGTLTTLTAVSMSGNQATSGNGGGIFNFKSSVTLVSSTVSGNSATSIGGGIFNGNTGSLSISDSTLSGNSGSTGGGIYNVATASLSISGSTLSGNSANYGGGIHSVGALTLSTSTLSANTATNSGGGINSTGTLTVTRSLFRDNVASNGSSHGSGGALQIDKGVATLTSTTLSGNQANGSDDAGGGALMASMGTVTLTNVTVVGNSTTSTRSTATDGGGGGISAHPGTTVTLQNTIVAGNSATGGKPDLSGALISAGHNLIGDPTGGTGVTSGVGGDVAGTAEAPLAPRLRSPADNGGPTQTRALLAGSPAIDAADSAACPATDQRGYSRSGLCDIGAYEAGSVVQLNQAPTLDQPADRAILEDAGEQVLGLAGIGPGASDAGQILLVTVASSNPLLIPMPTVSYISPAATGSLRFTPAPDASGSATITVTVRDDGGAAAGGVDTLTRTFTVTVAPVNDAPDFTPGANQTASAGAGVQMVTGWATGFTPGPVDEAGQTVLSYVVVANSGPELFAVAPIVDESGTLRYTPKAGASGTATIGIVVRDSGGTADGGVDISAARTATITVAPTGTNTVYLPMIAGR